jgi:hypothetical protein
MRPAKRRSQYNLERNFAVAFKKSQALQFSFVIQAGVDAFALYNIIFIVIRFSVPDDVQRFAHGVNSH